MSFTKFTANMVAFALMLFVIIGAGCNEQQTQQDSGSIQFKENISKAIADADIVYEKDGWKLLIYKTNKGTRSEGRNGRLFKDGKEIFAKRGETLETPIGKLLYNGSQMEAANLWDATGWSVAVSGQSNQGADKAEISQFRPGRQKTNVDKLKKSFEEFDAKHN